MHEGGFLRADLNPPLAQQDGCHPKRDFGDILDPIELGSAHSFHANPPSVGNVTPTVAEAGAGESRPGGSPPRRIACPVPDIAPCQGWTLCQMAEVDDDGFRTTLYIARGHDRDVVLDHSRFSFTPTQARFEWFVRNGFPCREGIGPWDNHDLDLKIAAACLREMAGAA